jgi:hypothetical protein
MPDPTQPGGTVTAAQSGAIALVVFGTDKVDEIMARASTLLETQHRHELDMLRAGAAVRPNGHGAPNACCHNCVLC